MNVSQVDVTMKTLNRRLIEIALVATLVSIGVVIVRCSEVVPIGKRANVLNNWKIGVSHTLGCTGLSPTGVEWNYLLPKHTGTAAAVRAIFNATGVCHVHSHTYRRPPRKPDQPMTGFGFTLLQSPYKRLLSNCVFMRVCSVPKTDEQEKLAVKIFRNFIQARRYKIVQITNVMGPPRPGYDMYGRTSHLGEDLHSIFKILGYGDQVLQTIADSSTYHCITSCNKFSQGAGKNVRNRVFKAPASHTEDRADEVQWYDEATAQIVQKEFHRDFRRFGFSTDPLTMGNTSILHPRFDAVKLNLQALQRSSLHSGG
jgi:hypothetical protein